MNLKNRVKRLEKNVRKANIGTINENYFQMVYMGDPDYEKRIEQLNKDWMAKYGSLYELRIETHNIPDPDPIDMDFYKAED